MDTTTTTPSSILPGQQVPGNIPEAVASGGALAAASTISAAAGSGSGSIGPFFAVMSVLVVLLVGSCMVGRVVDVKAAEVGPLESVKYGDGWVGWLMRRWSRCVVAGGDLEVGRGKVVAEENSNP